jgi:DNA-binding HxlR family transcriptional regulator
MAKKRFDDSNCSVARALNQVGDWWSLLVVLHAMYGTRRFVDFQQELGIAKNILCDRLARLTEKGRDLFPVVIALRQWGNKWNPGSDDASLDLHDRTTGQPIQMVQVQNAEGEPITVRDVFVSASPVPGTKKDSA